MNTTPVDLTLLFFISQVLYTCSFLVMLYFFTRAVNWVNTDDAYKIPESQYPKIILFYPVLKESEDTMRTTMLGLGQMNYPKDKYRIIAIPNSNDAPTITSIKQLMTEFAFLEMVQVPPTSDPSWDPVWKAWESNPQAYWWHRGKYAHVKDLPPKKTRQMLYAFYNIVAKEGDDWLLDYIDADSVPPKDHFLAAAAGMLSFDVLQSTNVAGNLLDTWPASFHSMDHMCWDGLVYPHLSADGKHPYWVLGKGLFFKAHDLMQFGGFHPWITIEDPEVGMRLWTNGKRIGMIANPLIEEVPVTFERGILQRKRWTCGFYQSLSSPLSDMGMTKRQQQKARLNLLPTLSLLVNAIGAPTNIWVLMQWLHGTTTLPTAVNILALINVVSYVVLMGRIYYSTWNRTGLVLNKKRDRLHYMFRVNPVFLWFYWMLWLIPIFQGLYMYIFDLGKIWERTLKEDRNKALVREKIQIPGYQPDLASPILDTPVPALAAASTNGWMMNVPEPSLIPIHSEQNPTPKGKFTYLDVLAPKGESKRVALNENGVIIGRSPNRSDVQIHDEFVSRVHVRLNRDLSGSWQVADLCSAHGTWLGERLVSWKQPMPWKNGEIITIGQTKLRLIEAEKPLENWIGYDTHESLSNLEPSFIGALS